MRRMIFLAIGLFLFSIPSFAQEVIYPKAEVFGGFSMSNIPGVTTFDPTTGVPSVSRKSLMGWQASANYNLTHHFAIVGDFGGQYGSIAGRLSLHLDAGKPSNWSRYEPMCLPTDRLRSQNGHHGRS